MSIFEPDDSAPASRADAVAHFRARLRFETDPTDVAAALAAGERFAFVDVRSRAAWNQGRAAGAVHIPRAELADRATEELALDVPVAVYCWGVACNGATRAALELSGLGYRVKEMIGGFEYWAREGLAVVDDAGPVERAADPLTMVVAGEAAPVTCDC